VAPQPKRGAPPHPEAPADSARPGTGAPAAVQAINAVASAPAPVPQAPPSAS
jgi:hypothetical protein